MKNRTMNHSVKKIWSLILLFSFFSCAGNNTANNDGNANLPDPRPDDIINPNTKGLCAPITGPITFTVQNAHFDSSNIYAGPILDGPQNGTVQIGPGGTGPFNRRGVDGILSLDIDPATSQDGTSIAPKLATIRGQITLSEPTQQDIRRSFGETTLLQNPQNPVQPLQLCVHDLGLNLGYYQTLLFGRVYLYIQGGNTQGYYAPRGYELVF